MTLKTHRMVALFTLLLLGLVVSSGVVAAADDPASLSPGAGPDVTAIVLSWFSSLVDQLAAPVEDRAAEGADDGAGHARETVDEAGGDIEPNG